MNTKTYLIILGSSFALMILGSLLGNILESSGTLTREKTSPKKAAVIKLTYLVLFFVMAFAIVPVVIRFFIVMQLKIGNGNFIFVKWIQAHEQGVVYGWWGMIALGIVMISFLAKDDILKDLR